MILNKYNISMIMRLFLVSHDLSFVYVLYPLLLYYAGKQVYLFLLKYTCVYTCISKQY